MARMPEEQARKNIVRFFDPRLHHIGFGIELMGYGDPKERLILIYRKGDDEVESPGLSVIPLEDTQRLTLYQFCILAEHIIQVAMEEKSILENQCLCSAQVDLQVLQYPVPQSGIPAVSIYDAVDQMNRIIEFLHEKLPWKNVQELVWQSI